MVKRLTAEDVSRLLGEHSAGTSPGFLLWHATLRWQRVVAAALKTEGLTHVQFSILGTVWWFGRTGRHPSQREVSEHAGLDRVMMSQVVRQMERDGLVERTVDQFDTRVRRINITPAGKAIAERAVALMDEVDREFFRQAGPLPGIVEILAPLAGRDTTTGDPI
ncbi:MAG: MarR family transcriptional regulator [Frankiales bacterium]|jgi:DNA-binding MarR family transcriptional regulator|nr:MarR family transcriptional regulator [Frankiales bacterium]